MSNDPSNGTPPPPPDDDSPKSSDESLKESPEATPKADKVESSASGDVAPAVDAQGGEPVDGDGKDPDTRDAEAAKADSERVEDGDKDKNEDGGTPGIAADDDGEVKPDSDSSVRAGKDPASDHEGDDHEWHSEHDEYHPEYDDPYHDEYEDTYHHDGDEHYYEDHDEEYHHDEDHSHSSGHAIAPAASLPQKPDRSGGNKEVAPKKDDDRDDWDDEEEDEEGGGPVKSFLEHLEDLRWVLIKCVVSVLVCMCVCLVAANKALDILMLPLKNAKIAVTESMIEKAAETGDLQPTLQIQFGEDQLETTVSTNLFESFGEKFHVTNDIVALRVVPKPSGDGMVLGLEPADEVRDRAPPVDLPELSPKSPLTPFMLALKTAFFGGFGLASPLVFFFIAQFVVPALHRHERKYLGWGVCIGTGLFALGVVFAYVVIAKMMLMASVTFTDWLGFNAKIWIIDDYIAVMLKLLLGVGLGFELPVVLLTLVRIGILDYPKLVALRMYAFVGVLVMSALLTPPDVISQVMMSLPLWLLYEISVQIARIWYWRDQRAAAAEEAAEKAKSGS